MGALYSMLGWAEQNDEPDAILGLTEKEKKTIQSSWSKLMENSTESGRTIMISFFTRYPEYKQLFPFKDVPLEELNHEIRFKVHCNTVMYNLSQIINNLGEAELILAMLDKLAANHVKHGASAQGFRDIEIVILDILEKTFSREAYEAWKKLLDVVMTHISNKLSVNT